MASVTKISNPNPHSISLTDSNLIGKNNQETFLGENQYIELCVYDPNNTLVYPRSPINPPYRNYTVKNDNIAEGGVDLLNSIILSPSDDLNNLNFTEGSYIISYKFYERRIGDQYSTLFVSEISSNRTEIKLKPQFSNEEFTSQASTFISLRDESDNFLQFSLNFGLGNVFVAINAELRDENTDDPYILIKLYEPLPSDFPLKSSCWVITQFSDGISYSVNFPSSPIQDFIDYTTIAGPNFNIPLKGEVNNSTQPLNYNDLLLSAPTSSQNQLNSLLISKSIAISVDYTDFGEFIYFSSAQTRLENFYYKVGLIENYSSSISDLSLVTSSQVSIDILENKISKVIENFDQFEYFLYYDSGSIDSSGSLASWPKTTSSPPYLLAKTGSSTVLDWYGSSDENSSYYGGRRYTASIFDESNQNQLLSTIPEYLRDNASTKPYQLFVDMVAQHYDNIWIYTKDITQKYNADNRLDYGVSKDLVADAIRDFGVKL